MPSKFGAVSSQQASNTVYCNCQIKTMTLCIWTAIVSNNEINTVNASTEQNKLKGILKLYKSICSSKIQCKYRFSLAAYLQVSTTDVNRSPMAKKCQAAGLTDLKIQKPTPNAEQYYSN